MDDESRHLEISYSQHTPRNESMAQRKLEIDWNFPEDEDHAGLTQALAEQQQIGWHNFFKGRISKTWTTIQQRE